MKNFKITVIVPAFNEENNIFLISQHLVDILKKYYDYEIIFIDDGSCDATLDNIKKTAKNNSAIKYISLSRNFGHQNALKAGIDHASGDCVISLDADLQQPPELINLMVEKWQQGFDVVYTLRREGKELSLFKLKTSNLFYWLMNHIFDVKLQNGAADFRLLDRRVVDILKNMNESFLFYRGLICWLGFRQCSIEYNPTTRIYGTSKYGLGKMVKLALDGITSFSIKPLYFAAWAGFFISFVAFIYGVHVIWLKLFTQSTVPGWASVLVSVLFIGGLQLLTLGILGIYLGKLFIESKHRPIYIVKEHNLI